MTGSISAVIRASTLRRRQPQGAADHDQHPGGGRGGTAGAALRAGGAAGRRRWAGGRVSSDMAGLLAERGLVIGTGLGLGGVAGQGQEDVVERGGVHGEA